MCMACVSWPGRLQDKSTNNFSLQATKTTVSSPCLLQSGDKASLGLTKIMRDHSWSVEAPLLDKDKLQLCDLSNRPQSQKKRQQAHPTLQRRTCNRRPTKKWLLTRFAAKSIMKTINGNQITSSLYCLCSMSHCQCPPEVTLGKDRQPPHSCDICCLSLTHQGSTLKTFPQQRRWIGCPSYRLQPSLPEVNLGHTTRSVWPHHQLLRQLNVSGTSLLSPRGDVDVCALDLLSSGLNRGLLDVTVKESHPTEIELDTRDGLPQRAHLQ